MLILSLLMVVMTLAFANGANDVSRGIATLVGSGRAKPSVAIGWGSGWTVVGAFSGCWLATRLLEAYSGGVFLNGHGTNEVPLLDAPFFLAAAVAATLWVGFATWRKLPVSSTHALTGGLIGSACAAFGWASIDWSAAGLRFLLPLAISPLLAFLLIALFQRLGQRFCHWCGQYCVCVEQRTAGTVTAEGTLCLSAESCLTTGSTADCDSSPVVTSRFDVMDMLHWGSGALISFARGLNDMPKILALGWAAGALGASLGWAFGLGALAMGAGCLFAGRRVTQTMGFEITRITPQGGFLANSSAALLVTLASPLGLPVSTTHVTGGAIMGLGLQSGSSALHWSTIRQILFAWLVTMPCCILIALLLRHLFA